MIGVTNPSSRGINRSTVRALVALSLGYAVTTSFLVLGLGAVTNLMGKILPISALRVGLVLGLATLSVADLIGRTPQTQRQVPQRFARDLNVGTRNFIWGLDLGLLATSQKTTSLIWMAFLGALFQPASHTLIAVPLVAAGGFIGSFVVGALAPPSAQLSSRLNGWRVARVVPTHLPRISGALGAIIVVGLIAGV